MHGPFELISEYFWLIAIGVGVFNYVMARRAVRTSVPVDRLAEADSYVNRFALMSTSPWVVMGAGQLLGFTPTIWFYFRPQDGNPFVIAWFATAFAVTCTYAWWVLLAGGAEKVRDLRLLATLGQHRFAPQSLFSIKLFAGVGPIFFVAWVLLVSSMNVPLPR